VSDPLDSFGKLETYLFTRYSLNKIGVGTACAAPPSEPDVRISRIRLSGRRFYLMRTG